LNYLLSQSWSIFYMLTAKHWRVHMPKGPNGEKRPADAIGLAVLIGRIATGDADNATPDDGKDPAAKALGAKGGKKRADNMKPERRAEIAKAAAVKRWSKD
jgi:hypothetical protein